MEKTDLPVRYVALMGDVPAVNFLLNLTKVLPGTEAAVLISSSDIKPDDIYIRSSGEGVQWKGQYIGDKVMLANGAAQASIVEAQRVIVYFGSNADDHLTTGQLHYIAGIVKGMLRGRFPYSYLWGIPFKKRNARQTEPIHAWSSPPYAQQ